ncbi:Protein FAR1-RELATED SEQUENCE 5 [Linum grandiflorum]
MRMAFESWEDAGVFYNAYAKQVGFGIRIRDVQKSRDCKIRMVKWIVTRMDRSLVPNLWLVSNGFMKNRVSVTEFKQQWRTLMDKTGLDKNEWVKGLYEDLQMWCEAYLKDQFFAGMRTTSRCEGMNSTIKRYVKKQINLFEFIIKYDRMIDKLRFNESTTDFQASHMRMVCSHSLRVYENQAEELYTPTMFMIFREELRLVLSPDGRKRLKWRDLLRELHMQKQMENATRIPWKA